MQSSEAPPALQEHWNGVSRVVKTELQTDQGRKYFSRSMCENSSTLFSWKRDERYLTPRYKLFRVLKKVPLESAMLERDRECRCLPAFRCLIKRDTQ